MARAPISNKLALNALSAARSAIEIYNKPGFGYKQETYVVLMVNAWELLFKAYILKISKNKIKSILVQDPQKITTKKGRPNKHFSPKKSRAGNPFTIDIFSAITCLGQAIDPNLKLQIDVLVELRDNAIHFINDASAIGLKTLEVATATTKSFITCYREWFPEISFKESILPFGFQLADDIPVLGKGSEEVGRVLNYIRTQENRSTLSRHAVAFSMEISLKRNSNSGAAVSIDGKNPSSIPLKVIDTDLIDTKFKVDFDTLVSKLKLRDPQFKQNKKFWKVLKEIKINPQLCLIRFLDPRNQKSSKKPFFSEQAIENVLEKLK